MTTINFWEFIDLALGCRNFSSTIVTSREIMQSKGDIKNGWKLYGEL